MAQKYVYFLLVTDRLDGRADMKNLLGGKGANLAEMTSIGLPGSSRIHHLHRSMYRVLQE